MDGGEPSVADQELKKAGQTYVQDGESSEPKEKRGGFSGLFHHHEEQEAGGAGRELYAKFSIAVYGFD